jgi:exosortase
LSGRLITQLLALSRSNPTASHLIAVPFVSTALMWYDRRDIFSTIRAWRARPTMLAVGAIVLSWLLCSVWASAKPVDALTARASLLVVVWMALFLAAYGPSAFRQALFPLLFVALMIPIPDRLLAPVIVFLKKGSSEMVAGLFTVVGTPFHREHFIFALPDFTIEIADECSGIRSSIALLLTTLVAGHLFLRSGWRRAVLVLAVVPLAVAKNGVRIVTLSVLAEYVDRSFLDGALHHDGGILFFVVILALQFPLLVLLQRSEASRGSGVARA